MEITINTKKGLVCFEELDQENNIGILLTVGNEENGKAVTITLDEQDLIKLNSVGGLLQNNIWARRNNMRQLINGELKPI